MWKVTLKDGRVVKLRFLTADDKEKLFRMFSLLSEEALEWSGAPYTSDSILRWVNNISNMIPLVAENQSRIVGYAAIGKSPIPRKKGNADLAVYLHQDFHSVGLGTAMTEKIIELARKEKVHRIELTVVKENNAAIRLYEKFGFKLEGLSKDAFYGKDGKYHDIISMGLILPQC